MHAIFDMGNVLSHNVDVIPEICRITGVEAAEVAAFAGNDFHDLSTGRGSPQDFWLRFNTHFGTSVREDLIERCFQPCTDARMLTFIVWLKEQGVRTVCGTNTLDSHYRIHAARGDYAVFDAVYASHLLGVAKPDPAFFVHILKAEGWTAAQTMFIDDRADNVASARSLGLAGHVYQDFSAFRQWVLSLLELDGSTCPGQPAGSAVCTGLVSA
jgi:putative hydrolase of the HAD superfamily